MQSIGILGGMGSYATCSIFQRLLDAFPAEKEWDRPRIIIDNRCTMPSRVRAILYGEKEEQLVLEMSESVENLIRSGSDIIVLGCMTAHSFRNRLPHQEKILNALALTRVFMEEKFEEGTEVLCLCTEGSIATGIWTKALPAYRLRYPDKAEMKLLREFIEIVKKNQVTQQTKEAFREFRCASIQSDRCILLGCTELPVLMDTSQPETMTIVDPIACVIRELKARVGDDQ